MHDLWEFLLQTLTASGMAVLLLVIKAIFTDKLSPRWQFGIWGILGITLLLPTGIGGRYILFNWPLFIETLKTAITGDYSLSHVTAPVPFFPAAGPHTVSEWLFVLYIAGVMIAALNYLVSYLRLRVVLHKGKPVSADNIEKIKTVEAKYSLKSCRAIEVSGLPSAFVCGVFHPVLALPEGIQIDQKVLIHELMHLKNKDVIWGILICVFRCIHWCNPLLWYCANRAGNDLESLCDQRVLEVLEGEERREYGRILLSMANEKYARAPGTSSAANGGRNIRCRIEAIARFKRYPQGMTLVSVCMLIILAAYSFAGMKYTVQTADIHWKLPFALDSGMAGARLTNCTTPAGAIDSYAKAVIAEDAVCRAVCAPMTEHKKIADAALETGRGRLPIWNSGLTEAVDAQTGYAVYDMRETGEEAYQCLLVMKPIGQPDEPNMMRLITQPLQVEREGKRWVVHPLEPFHTEEMPEESIIYGCQELPAVLYSGQADDFVFQASVQKIYLVDNSVVSENNFPWGTQSSFDTTLKPDTDFSRMNQITFMKCEYVGTEEGKDQITQLGVSYSDWNENEPRPELGKADSGTMSGGSSGGGAFCSYELEKGWDRNQFMGGGGGGQEPDMDTLGVYPDRFAVDLYLNHRKVDEIVLLAKGDKR